MVINALFVLNKLLYSLRRLGPARVNSLETLFIVMTQIFHREKAVECRLKKKKRKKRDVIGRGDLTWRGVRTRTGTRTGTRYVPTTIPNPK